MAEHETHLDCPEKIIGIWSVPNIDRHLHDLHKYLQIPYHDPD
jgi:hypothetical protein